MIKIPLGCGSKRGEPHDVRWPERPASQRLVHDLEVNVVPIWGGRHPSDLGAPYQPDQPVDQEVKLTSFTIGAFKTTFARTGGRTPVFADLKCDFPGLSEFTMRVTPIDASNNPAGPSFIWGDGPGETFAKAENQPVAGDCQLRTEIPVTSFPAHDRESGWRFELLYNLVPVGQGDVSPVLNRRAAG